jgi:hypothetical protein
LSKRWNKRTIKNIENNLIGLLQRYPRSISAAGIVNSLVDNVSGIRNKCITPKSIAMFMLGMIGHNGIIRKRNGKFGCIYLYDSTMELMHNTRDFSGEVEWLI